MIGSISLVHGFLPPLVIALAVASLLLLLRRRDGVWKRQLLIGVPVSAAVVGLVALLVDGMALIPYQFPNSYYLWFGLIILGVAFSVVGWLRFSLGRRLISGVSLVLTVSMALMLVNGEYQYYPTIRSVLGGSAHQVSDAQLHDAAFVQNDRAGLEQARIKLAGGDPAAATKGATIQLPIPGTASGFDARAAYIWLPPVWFTHPERRLPVIELLAGVPGAPSDWTRAGFADQTASAFAQAHGGVAPIIVMPDANGSEGGDTECVNSPLGNAETYLSVDVPAFMRSTFGAQTGPDSMAIAGLSAGGMCATMLALRHPTIYNTLRRLRRADQPDGRRGGRTRRRRSRPCSADRRRPTRPTTRCTCSRPNSYPGMAAWFEVGGADSGSVAAQRQLAPLARQAGISTTTIEVPGDGHDFDLFSKAFADSLPFLSGRLGLTPAPANAA